MHSITRMGFAQRKGRTESEELGGAILFAFCVVLVVKCCGDISDLNIVALLDQLPSLEDLMILA